MAVFSFLTDRWKIYQKIGYGYGVAIAIGFVGSLAGIVMADYYQGQGLERLADAQRQSQLLKDYEREAEAFQLYGARLGVLPPGSDRFTQQVARMQTSLMRIEALQDDLEQFLQGEPSWLAVAPERIRHLTQIYTAELQRYQGQVQIQLASTVPPEQAQQQLQAIAVGDTALAMDTLHAQLISVLDLARSQEKRAGDEMEAAQGLEKLIIVLSILGSAVIAGAMAWKTTRAIAQPLESLTQTAQYAAQHPGFEGRVSVQSNDEIGTLAQSFNALMDEMSLRTKALEQSAHQANHQAQELERTLAMLRRTQSQLVQTEKMSSLGQMVAGVAHEINNPVSFIYGNLTHIEQYGKDLLALVDLYEAQFPQASPSIDQHREAIDLEFLRQDLPKLLASLNLGAERIRSIVLSLRIFARLDEADLKPVDLHEGLDSSLVILNSRLREQPHRPAIQVIKDYGEVPKVECHSGHLNQVFMNILANAVDALEERDAIEQAQGNTTWQPILRIKTMRMGDRVRILMSDNAMGMPAAVQAKIFDPFFTTKPVGKGTGLGMSISYEIIVKKHHGTIDVSSTPGQGTTFWIELPLQRSDRTSSTPRLVDQQSA